VFTYLSWISTYLYSNDNTKDLLKSSSVVRSLFLNSKDFSYKSYWFEQSFIFESIVLGLVIYKVVTIFRINRHVHIIILTFENAGKNIFIYLMILFPIILGFTLVGMNIWGPYLSDYRNFSNAFVAILFFTLGRINFNFFLGHTETSELMEYNYVWGIIFVVLFFIVVIYFLLTVFLAIYADSYRSTLIREGYPEDMAKYTKWNYKGRKSRLINRLYYLGTWMAARQDS
jgi:hypothetical protein